MEGFKNHLYIMYYVFGYISSNNFHSAEPSAASAFLEHTVNSKNSVALLSSGVGVLPIYSLLGEAYGPQYKTSENLSVGGKTPNRK